jgi:sucrose-6F-phosphate phosphohydrolase
MLMCAIKLLASDLDGTLIPMHVNEERRELIRRFNDAVGAVRETSLAYITGRHFDYALSGIQSVGLRLPDYIVCDVGTSIYTFANETWQLDNEYEERMRESWGGRKGRDVAHLLDHITELSEQESSRQSDFKQSYTAAPEVSVDVLADKIESALAAESVEASIIISTDAREGVTLIDILPPMSSKARALEYMQERLELDAGEILFAGDSGNDLLAFSSGVRAVVVGNTPGNVCDELRRMIAEGNVAGDHVYFATAHDVGGVLEGCRHFGLFAG